MNYTGFKYEDEWVQNDIRTLSLLSVDYNEKIIASHKYVGHDIKRLLNLII